MSDEVPEAGGDDELALLRQQNQQLEANLREARASADRRLMQIELKAAALQAGMIDPDGLKLIDTTAVTIDDQGTVHGVAGAISRTRREKPWLFQPSSSSSAATVPPHLNSRAKLATEMTLDEWRAARADLVHRR